MLKFFRKIRQKLINEGHLKRYLFYAFGEITLVVIGILIALQINNWNQERQENKELHTYLENIRSNMIADLESLNDIKSFRDSTIAYSWRWINLAKQKTITPEDLMMEESSPYGVFIDEYFQPRSSGFEALKTSGYIRKISGTDLEQKLNNYYYTLDKIRESETSLNNTIETMENLAFDKNVRQQIIEIMEAYRTNQILPASINAEIKKLVNHPNLIAAHQRNVASSGLLDFYIQAEKLAVLIIVEIENNLE